MSMLIISHLFLSTLSSDTAEIWRELVVKRRPGHAIELRGFADVSEVRDGCWIVRLKPGQGYAQTIAALAHGAAEVKALAPRVVGSVSGESSLSLMKKQLKAANSDYDKIPQDQRVSASPRKDQEELLEGYEAMVEGRRGVRAKKSGGLVAKSVAKVAAAPVWENLGPFDMGIPTVYGYGVGPVNGRVNCMAVEPTDNRKLYAATARGGLWRSTDFGLSWKPLSDNWSQLNTSVVKTNPSLPGRVYVGTGDQPQEFSSSIGLMVSTNSGDTFTPRGVAEFADVHITDVLVSPTHSSTLIVASGGAVGKTAPLYRTTNEGATWSAVIAFEAYWTDLDVSIPESNGTQYFYAAGRRNGDNCVLYRSSDNGANWNTIPLPVSTKSDHVYISCSKRTPTIVYIYYTSSRKVFKNSGLGGAWVEITGDLPMVSESDWGQVNFNTGLTCYSRTVNNITFDALFLSNKDTYVTTGPDTSGYANNVWQSFAKVYTNDDLVHTDHHAVVQDPVVSKNFYWCTDGGLARCTYDQATNTGQFVSLSKDMCAALTSRISVSPEPQIGILAGHQDNGTGFAATVVNPWTNLMSGDTGHTAINQNVPGFAYLMPPNFGGGVDAYIVETTDGWVTQNKRQVDTGEDIRRSSPPIVIDPTNSRYVYVATNYLYRYDSTTQNWASRLGNQKLDPSSYVRHLAVAPSNSNRIYTVSQSGDVWTTKDGGSTWAEISTGGQFIPNVILSHVSVDPNNERRVLVTVEDYSANSFLYECLDTGAAVRTWTPVHGTVIGKKLPFSPALAIQRHPDAPSSTWIVGGDAGVYVTYNSGKSWASLTPPGSIPQVFVTDVKIHPGGWLYISTYGRGVWRTKLPKVPGSIGHG